MQQSKDSPLPHIKITKITPTKECRSAITAFFHQYIKQQLNTDPVRIEKTPAELITDSIFYHYDYKVMANSKIDENSPFNLVDKAAWLVTVPDKPYPIGYLSLAISNKNSGFLEWAITIVKEAQGKGIGTRCIRFINEYMQEEILNKQVYALGDKKQFQGMFARILVDNFASLITHQREGFKVYPYKNEVGILSGDPNGTKLPCFFLYTADPKQQENYPDIARDLATSNAANAAIQLATVPKDERDSIKENLLELRQHFLKEKCYRKCC